MHTGLKDMCTAYVQDTQLKKKTTDGFMSVGHRTIIRSAAKCKLSRNTSRTASTIEFRNEVVFY